MTAEDPVRSVRVPPDGSAWREAQRRVAERNEQTRREGKLQRQEQERRLAALRSAARDGVRWPSKPSQPSA
jgi:hypothetical protein